MPRETRRQLHATCVSLGNRGVLLLGDSGSGKSDLALRLMDEGAALVADDQVVITLKNKSLMAAPHERLRGLLEVRGMGIMTLPYRRQAAVKLAVRLVERKVVERLPEPEFWGCLGQRVPLISLHAFDLSTCAKIRLFLQGL